MTQAPTTISLDGIQYAIDQFSPQVKQLSIIRNEWAEDLRKNQLEALKAETAIKTIESQLAQLVQTELAAKAKPAESPTE